jgi:hypothetical protein
MSNKKKLVEISEATHISPIDIETNKKKVIEISEAQNIPTTIDQTHKEDKTLSKDESKKEVLTSKKRKKFFHEGSENSENNDVSETTRYDMKRPITRKELDDLCDRILKDDNISRGRKNRMTLKKWIQEDEKLKKWQLTSTRKLARPGVTISLTENFVFKIKEIRSREQPKGQDVNILQYIKDKEKKILDAERWYVYREGKLVGDEKGFETKEDAEEEAYQSKVESLIAFKNIAILI